MELDCCEASPDSFESEFSVEGFDRVRSMIGDVLSTFVNVLILLVRNMFGLLVDLSSGIEAAVDDVILITFADRFFQLERMSRYNKIVLETE